MTTENIISRNIYAGTAKGIGIILVVYGHVARGLFGAGLWPSYLDFKLIDSVIYSFHMPLFFYLAGIFFIDSVGRRGRRNFLLNKIDLLVYPYLIWSSIQGIIEVALSRHTNGNAKLVDLFTFLWDPRAQFWYLYALFLIFILATIFYRKQSKQTVLIIAIFSTIIYFAQIVKPFDIKILGNTFGNFVFFGWGVLAKEFKLDSILFRKFSTSLLFFAFIISQTLFHASLGLTYIDRGVAHLVNAAIAIAFTISLSHIISNSKFGLITIIGSNSMCIYLMHILVGSGLRIILMKAFDIQNLYLHLVIELMSGIIIPIFVMKKYGDGWISFLFNPPRSISFDRSRPQRPPPSVHGMLDNQPSSLHAKLLALLASRH